MLFSGTSQLMFLNEMQRMMFPGTMPVKPTSLALNLLSKLCIDDVITRSSPAWVYKQEHHCRLQPETTQPQQHEDLGKAKGLVEGVRACVFV